MHFFELLRNEQAFNALRPGQAGRHFQIQLLVRKCILIQISLQVVLNGPIGSKPALGLIMAWRLSGAKPLS